MMEKDYVGLSEASSAAFNDDERDEERAGEDDDEEELELGLSLGAKKVSSGGGKNKAGAYSYRILTAKDFPAALGSRASPLSSPSSSVSSSSDGAKRVVDSACPDGSGTANPPSQVVGWPPIGAFRINSLVNQARENSSDAEAIANKKNNNVSNECINTTRNQEKKAGIISVGITRFMKVNLDGDPIGRKVDLSAHQSYETLALALEAMFYKPTTGLSSSAHSAKSSKLLDGSSEFVLTYEDKDGDWMLVGDVPWGMFLDTVKRLRIMRTSDANGLAPRFQSATGGLLRSKVASHQAKV